MSRLARCAILSLTAALAGCRRDEITVRRVPKGRAAPVAMAPVSAEVPDASGLRWTAPVGWKELPGEGMRIATFEPPQDLGRVEGTVVALIGDAGGELANVNRWRGQISLTPIEEDALGTLRRRVLSGAGEVSLYDFTGGDAAKTRLLAAMIKVGEKTWFFKLTGTQKAAEAARPAFLELLEGLTTHEA